MRYAILGRTGLKVSRLGFGAMRLPMDEGKVDRKKALPMFRAAFEEGVNYVDTAVGYCRGDSQRVIGEVLDGWRGGKIVVSTKNPYYNKHDDRPWWKNLEDSLKYLRLECIDVYKFHGLNWRTFRDHVAGKDGQLKWIRRSYLLFFREGFFPRSAFLGEFAWRYAWRYFSVFRSINRCMPVTYSSCEILRGGPPE